MRLGKVGRRNFDLPVELGVRTSAIHGIRGTGKTVTASVIAEELLKVGMQVAIVDPTDSWWGLKSSLDGQRDGFPIVVLGGEHGDLPLEDSGGRVVADFVVEHRASVVLSLRHLRKARQRQLVTDFAEQLYHRKGETAHRTPLTLIIDEASQFVPQRVMGDSARMVGAIQDLVRMGRSAGVGVVLVDQRPASVNKDVLTQIELLVAHRITSPQDRKALQEWIRQHDSEGREAEFLADLASLPVGEAYFWSPAADVFERVQVRMRETFDSSKTPKLGEDPVAPDQVAAVDLESLRAQLEETIAKAEANDPKTLKQRIRELEGEVRQARAGAPSEEDLEAAREQGRREAAGELKPYIASLESKVSAADDGMSTVSGAVERTLAVLRNGAERPTALDAPAAAAARPARARRTKPAAPPAPAPALTTEPSGAREELSTPQRKILDTLAELETIGIRQPDRSVVAVLAGASPRSSAYANNLGRLRSGHGLIDYPQSGCVALTDEGRAAAAAVDAPVSLTALHDSFKQHLSGPQGRILEVLTEIYPESIDREQLAERTDASPTSSAFANNLGRMRTLGILDYPESGAVVATDLLFPAGLY